MKNLILIFTLCVLGLTTEAQTYNKLYTGATKDSLVASQTIYKIINVDANDVQTVSVQVFIDSTSGTTSGTATLYQSIDGINFETTGQSASWETGVDTTFTLTDTAFYGVYLKFEIVATATAQKAAVTATLKSWNKN